jgi:hypothetical protein
MSGGMHGPYDVPGCGDPEVASARASEMVAAVTTGADTGGCFLWAMASQCLAAYLRAAALAETDMRQVGRWAGGRDPQQPEHILTGAGDQQRASLLSELGNRRARRTAASVRMVMSAAVARVS